MDKRYVEARDKADGLGSQNKRSKGRQSGWGYRRGQDPVVQQINCSQ